MQVASDPNPVARPGRIVCLLVVWMEKESANGPLLAKGASMVAGSVVLMTGEGQPTLENGSRIEGIECPKGFKRGKRR